MEEEAASTESLTNIVMNRKKRLEFYSVKTTRTIHELFAITEDANLLWTSKAYFEPNVICKLGR